MNSPNQTDSEWAEAKVHELIKTCEERAEIVLEWAEEILDTWI